MISEETPRVCWRIFSAYVTVCVAMLIMLCVLLLYLRNMIVSLKETSNKDLSTLAKAAFELLKWRILWEPHLQKAVSMILALANDSNWRTRSATLTFLRTFMYRYDTWS